MRKNNFNQSCFLSSFLMLFSISILICSCGVSKTEHISLKRSYEKLRSNNDYLQKKMEACEAENKELEKQYKGGRVVNSVMHEQVKIELIRCTQKNELITCELLYTSQRNDDKRFSFYGTPKAYDMEGNGYKHTDIIMGGKKLAGFYSYKLPFNTPVKGIINLGTFDQKISKLKLLSFKTLFDKHTSIEFKNIPVRH